MKRRSTYIAPDGRSPLSALWRQNAAPVDNEPILGLESHLEALNAAERVSRVPALHKEKYVSPRGAVPRSEDH